MVDQQFPRESWHANVWRINIINKVFYGFLVVFCGTASLRCLTCLQLFLSWIMAPMKPRPNFCYKNFFSDMLLALKVKFVVQQPINSSIINFNNFVPWTSNVLMFKYHEIIVVFLENKKGMQKYNMLMYVYA
jgi:hypothetical protein